MAGVRARMEPGRHRATSPPALPEALARPDIRDLRDDVVADRHLDGELSFAVKVRWILGLTILCWAIIAAAISTAWRYFL